MRLRNKQWTKPFIEENKQYMIEFDADKKELIDFKNLFNNKNEITCLEIGCGKGDFVIGQSLIHPDFNFVAMEKETTVIGVALKKAINVYKEKDKELNNVKFLNHFAEKLTDMFPKNTFDYIFLNFSDPWPKAKHYRKRLTYRDFLDVYAQILKPNGIIEMKTDNDKLFAFTLEELKERPNFKVEFETTDLYSDLKYLDGNVQTEYEKRFHEAGKNINKIILKNIK